MEGVGEAAEEDEDVTEMIKGWDGCSYIEALGESPNVPGVGEVSQVTGTPIYKKKVTTC